MRIAFGIVSLFPGGGLQRDCMEIAKLIRNQGPEVVIYTCRLRDYGPADDIPVIALQNDESTNHARQYKFAIDFLNETSKNYDLIVGFDKLLGLDVLYCADASIAYRMLKHWYLYLVPRYRTFRFLEKSSFASNGRTQIVLVSASQAIEYQSAWGTVSDHMIVVPPTLSPTRRHPEWRTNDNRQKIRSLLGIGPSVWLWLSIGVQPKTKGIDRTIDALSKFPNAQLLIAGLNQTDRASQSLAERAQNLGVASRIKWLGHQEDIPHVMSAADLLVHPARYDTTGTVILEAIVNGLPVITTAACGYAHHVEAADAGIVIREPFDFSLFIAALNRAQEPDIQHGWSVAGAKYGGDVMLYRGRERAAEIIMEVGQGLRKIRSRDANPVHFHNFVAKRHK